MNEQLQQALTALILKLTDMVANVSSSVSDALPELVRQLIGFNIMKFWIWIGVEAFVVITFPIFILWSIGYVRNKVKSHEEARLEEKARQDPFYENGNTWFCIIMGIIWAWAGISIVQDVIQLVKLYNFPLVWTLDYLKDLTAK
jgi:hypothetical protein